MKNLSLILFLALIMKSSVVADMTYTKISEANAMLCKLQTEMDATTFEITRQYTEMDDKVWFSFVIEGKNIIRKNSPKYKWTYSASNKEGYMTFESSGINKKEGDYINLGEYNGKTYIGYLVSRGLNFAYGMVCITGIRK